MRKEIFVFSIIIGKYLSWSDLRVVRYDRIGFQIFIFQKLVVRQIKDTIDGAKTLLTR